MTNLEIKAWRESKDFSQPEMADYIGIPFTTFRNWESGIRKPGKSGERLLQLVRLVDTFNPDLLKM